LEGGILILNVTGTAISSGTQLTVENFPTLKIGDEIILYAKWNPKFVELDRTSPDILKMPTQREYRAYIYNMDDVYYDESYTNDQQPGYWLKKWTSGIQTIENEKSFTGFDAYDGTDVYKFLSCKIGRPQTNKDDYFFIPLLGAIINDKVEGVGYANIFWASDINSTQGGQYMTVQFFKRTAIYRYKVL
jgi:hypothetical protein